MEWDNKFRSLHAVSTHRVFSIVVAVRIDENSKSSEVVTATEHRSYMYSTWDT